MATGLSEGAPRWKGYPRLSEHASELKALMDGEGEVAGGRSELVRLAARLIIEEALEGEAEDAWDAATTPVVRSPGAGYRNGYRAGRLNSAEGSIAYSAPQIAERAEPFRSRIREIAAAAGRRNWRRLAVEMYARGLSTRDIEALFADETGKPLLSRTAVSDDHRAAVGGV